MNCFVYLNRIKQRPNNIVMIGKNRNNHYRYNRLILETSIKITKMRIMRWGTDKSGYVNHAKITQPLNIKFLLTRKLE